MTSEEVNATSADGTQVPLSIGGVTIGNAIVQQPALFAAAIDNVGDTNGVRDEFAVGGTSNIPEFGTVTNRTGFNALYATDAYVQMKPGVAYPTVLRLARFVTRSSAQLLHRPLCVLVPAARRSGFPLAV
jgi:prolyl oligopeptidase PreP (S9A serine peptidase family)